MLSLRMLRPSTRGRASGPLSILAAGVLGLAACAPASGPGATSQSGTPAAAGSDATQSGTPALVGQTSAPGVPGPSLTPTSAPRTGGQVVVGDIGDVKTLNPFLVNDPTSDVVTSRIYASLLSVDPKTGEPKPNLAEKFDLSSDGKILTFQLRDGLKFSDGSALTGDDFKFTVDASLRSKKTTTRTTSTRSSAREEYMDGTATTLGHQRRRQHHHRHAGECLLSRAERDRYLAIIPKSVFGKYLDPKDPSRTSTMRPRTPRHRSPAAPSSSRNGCPTTTSPSSATTTTGRKANIDEWVHKVYPNQDALTAALKVGEVDMAQFDPKDVQDMQSVNTLQVFSYLNLGYTFIGWNQQRGGKEFLQDKAVRQALAYGLNVDQVVDKVLFGEGVKMIAPHAAGVVGLSTRLDLNDYKYDPAKAEQLLQDDGWAKGGDGIYAKDGQKLEFSLVDQFGQ